MLLGTAWTHFPTWEGRQGFHARSTGEAERGKRRVDSIPGKKRIRDGHPIVMELGRGEDKRSRVAKETSRQPFRVSGGKRWRRREEGAGGGRHRGRKREKSVTERGTASAAQVREGRKSEGLGRKKGRLAEVSLIKKKKRSTREASFATRKEKRVMKDNRRGKNGLRG